MTAGGKKHFDSAKTYGTSLLGGSASLGGLFSVSDNGEEAREQIDREVYNNTKYATTEEALKMFQDDELVAEPGKNFKYSTHGFTVVAAVCEKASGEVFKDLLQDLFHQLGMGHTSVDTNSNIVLDRVRYYSRNAKGKLENCPEVDNSYKWAGGGIISSVEDLLIFGNAVLYRPRNNIWYHEGCAVGASSVLLIEPSSGETGKDGHASGVCVAILTNLHGVSLKRLAEELAAVFRK